MNGNDNFYSESRAIDLRQLIGKYLNHWPIFMASVSICIALAFLYLRLNDQLTYSVYAKLLIKDENSVINPDQTGSTSSTGPKIVGNEIEILRSRMLMQQVVNNLKLWIQYETPGKYHDEDIYGRSPVILNMISPNDFLSGKSIEILIKDEKRFAIKQGNLQTLVPFNTQLRDDLGLWSLEPTGEIRNFLGRTVKISFKNPENVISDLINKLYVNLSADDATVLNLMISETVPQRGKNILTGLIEAYSSTASKEKNTISENTLKFIDERLASLKEELAVVEKDVESFRSSQRLTDLSSESQLFFNNVKDNDMRLNEVNMQLQLINEIEKYISSPNGAATPPVTVGIPDAGLASLVNQLVSLQLQKDKMLANIPEGNPVFDPVIKQISTLKKKISENVQGVKRSLTVTRKQFQNYNSKFEASIKKLPGQEREFINIKRQQSIKEELYIYLLKKKEEAGVGFASSMNGSRIVDQAYVGAVQGINKGFTYSLAFILGLFLPVGVIFTKDLLNNKISSVDEIEDLLMMPVLCELIYEKSSSPIVGNDGRRTMLGEQFRSLRINLKSIHSGSRVGKVTMVTSGIPGEGKSFVTSNLGVSIATAGRRTVIVEVDFRNPVITRNFNLKGQLGLSSYLLGEVSKEKIIQSWGPNENLFIIGSGPLPPNSTELLEQPKFEELLAWLRMEFDEILLDTPPLHVVSDAMILSAFSDSNLYVIRHAHTHKADLPFVKQLQNKLHNVHVIYNGTDLMSKYSYRRNYYYQYYSEKKLLHAGPSRAEDI